MNAAKRNSPAPLASGVFRSRDESALNLDGTRPPVDRMRISLRTADSKASLLAAMSTQLGFPEWFGGNWDALEDSLCDLGWRPLRKLRSLVIEDSGGLAQAAPEEFRIFTDVLRASAEYWRGRGGVFCVLFIDPADRLALPELPGAK